MDADPIYRPQPSVGTPAVSRGRRDSVLGLCMRSCPVLGPLLAVVTTCAATAAPANSGYDNPPQYVLDVLHAPSPPNPYVSPTGDRILLVSWVRYPPITQVAEPFLRLPGA